MKRVNPKKPRVNCRLMRTKNSGYRSSHATAGDVKFAVVRRILRFIIRSFGLTWDQTPKRI